MTSLERPLPVSQRGSQDWYRVAEWQPMPAVLRPVLLCAECGEVGLAFRLMVSLVQRHKDPFNSKNVHQTHAFPSELESHPLDIGYVRVTQDFY